MNVVGQLSVIPTSEKIARLYPLCRQLFVVILVIIMSISVVLDTKAAIVGITSIMFLVHWVVFKSRELGSRNFISSILLSICRCKKYSNTGQGETFEYESQVVGLVYSRGKSGKTNICGKV